ncbi:hypothetical protein FJ938_13115 [Mesorhizobium sp. B2-4-14]|uniref:hypothetical protein n=1 Tax=Mesorhizobium sp. B2-4-14 TaxID=2589935 RepID=UPI001126A5B4|nr:hypothetical protein [Mesorhizobium sp. B2-4-14]TPL06413.1 hypothetical protein FJ938_13115 [Mesorhizobium sp. B2-4-14]
MDIEWLRVLGACRHANFGPLAAWLRSDRAITVEMRASLARELDRRPGRPRGDEVRGAAAREVARARREDRAQQAPLRQAAAEYRGTFPTHRRNGMKSADLIAALAVRYGVDLNTLADVIGKSRDRTKSRI